ncbi:hypothetical protein [Bifidobacterium longum]|uniref:hypothetical protein n=1 Tax=Bifidobacterium longum TaxID=216816 RepID=UPI0013F16295|nr:hypothetical protein [Bifidobacterium longum]
MMAVNCVFCQVGVPERNTDLTKNIESPDILHNGHRYRHDPFLPEHRPAATGRIQFESQLGNIQAAAPMPLTSPGNDDGTGENHQPTPRKNTAEPAQQTLKQYIHASNPIRLATPHTTATHHKQRKAQLLSCPTLTFLIQLTSANVMHLYASSQKVIDFSCISENHKIQTSK